MPTVDDSNNELEGVYEELSNLQGDYRLLEEKYKRLKMALLELSSASLYLTKDNRRVRLERAQERALELIREKG